MHDDTVPTVPGYTLEALIGRGGSSQVWRATGPQGVVAIKVGFEPSVTGRAEWRMLRRHAGPHVVEALDLVTAEDGRSCLVLEHMAGGSLDDVVRGRGGLTAGECVTVLTPVATTLAGFHERSCVHGDLTPRNVLFDHRGRPAITDLGATRVAAQPEAAEWATCGFAAPEVADGEAPTAAADVYAFGALAWFCLVGQAPPVAALRPHLRDLLPDTPIDLVELVTACLAQTPSSRPHAVDLAPRLRTVAPPRPVPVPLRPTGSEMQAEPDSITRRLRDEAQRHQLDEASRHDGGGRGRRARRHDDAGEGPSTGRGRGGLRRSRDGGGPMRNDLDATTGGRGRTGTWAALAVGAVIVTGAVVWPLHTGDGGRAAARPQGSAAQSGSLSALADVRIPGRTGSTAMMSGPATQDSATGASPRGGTSPASSPASGPASAGVRGASRALTPTAAEVSDLLACRAGAWNALDAPRLSSCLRRGSAAHTQDTTAFTTASHQGVRYRGLTYTVGALVPVTCADGDACVTTDVTGSAYDVVHDGATQHVAAHTEPVRLTFSRDGGEWRIVAWAKR